MAGFDFIGKVGGRVQGDLRIMLFQQNLIVAYQIGTERDKLKREAGFSAARRTGNQQA